VICLLNKYNEEKIEKQCSYIERTLVKMNMLSGTYRAENNVDEDIVLIFLDDVLINLPELYNIKDHVITILNNTEYYDIANKFLKLATENMDKLPTSNLKRAQSDIPSEDNEIYKIEKKKIQISFHAENRNNFKDVVKKINNTNPLQKYITEKKQSSGLLNNGNFALASDQKSVSSFGENSNHMLSNKLPNIFAHSASSFGESSNHQPLLNETSMGYKQLNLTAQKSTNFTASAGNSNVKPFAPKSDIEKRRSTGINGSLTDRLREIPKIEKAKQLKKSKKKASKNSKSLVAKILERMPVHKNSTNTNNIPASNPLKAAISGSFYDKNKIIDHSSEENNSNLANSNTNSNGIISDTTKYSKRSASTTANNNGFKKYELLFSRKKLGIPQSVRKDVSPARSNLTDDEILCEDTPTKHDAFKFNKKSPNTLRGDFVKLMTQK
jgi:hypothetical protein